MKLKFVLDQAYDRKMAKKFGFSKAALDRVDAVYKTSLPYVKLTQQLYQKSWDQINGGFSAYIEKITGYPWFYPEYTCVISVIHKGISNWGTAPRIVR